MSDASEKQFGATPSKIAKARKDGNVARSQELSANGAFIAAAFAVAAVAPEVSHFARDGIARAAGGESAFAQAAAIAACGVAVIGAAAVGATAASIAQTGGLLFIAPSPKFSRLLPMDGIKRMFSRETVTHAFRAIAACIVATTAMFPTLRSIFAMTRGSATATAIAGIAWSGAMHVVSAAAAVGAVFAALEYGIARKSWLAKLKMSLYELKRELKENDGDPMTRARRRALHRGMIRGAIGKVKDAAFVVVNPTHVAIALEYRPPEVAVPVVLVRAADEMALRVREAAAEAHIPVIENVPLARALYAASEVGEAIPASQYVAVAEIVVHLIRSGALE